MSFSVDFTVRSFCVDLLTFIALFRLAGEENLGRTFASFYYCSRLKSSTLPVFTESNLDFEVADVVKAACTVLFLFSVRALILF